MQRIESTQNKRFKTIRSLNTKKYRAELSLFDLHLRSIALGGYTTLEALTEHCASGGVIADDEHDLVVLALNERFLELRSSERLPTMR